MKKGIPLLIALAIMTAQTKAQEKPAGAVRSHTVVHFLPGDFLDAGTENLAAADFPEGAFRPVGGGSKPVAAVLTSAPLRALFPFDQLLLTANASLGPGDELACQAQVETGSGWSPWFDFGSYNLTGGAASVRNQENPFGRMDIDILALKSRARRFRYRIRLSTRAGSAPGLRLVSAVYTDTSLVYNETAALKKTLGVRPVKLAVPQYSQMLEQVNYSRDICSPASLAMVLDHFGVKTSTLGAAAAVLDSTEGIYGNWSFNTRYAGTKGLYAWIARINSMDEAEAYLAAGIPLIASVTFGPDELKKSPLKKTAGHLLVLKGFNAKGDVITNDPAAPDLRTVERTYDRGEFARAWLGNKYGTAYAVTPAPDSFISVRPPFAGLFSAPAGSGKDAVESLVETQVLPGERIRLLEGRGGWLKVEALEQPHRETPDAKNFAPYSGWIEAANAAFSPPYEPEAVVKAKKAALEGAARGWLSIGVKIKILGREKNSGLRALLPGGESGVISEKDVNYLPVKAKGDDLRGKILETARQFLGDEYRWGGRSGFGADCSGLVNLAYRVWGVDLPRNAADQFAFSKSVPRESLKPADLVFSAAPGEPEHADHVMLYSGNGRIIEATRDTDSVREIPFREKFGLELGKTKNGQLINGKKIYFRRVIKVIR